MGRSIRLFKAFRKEQSQPEVFYGALADDTILSLKEYTSLSGALVLDVGAGPVQFAESFASEGARYVGLEVDAHTLARTDLAVGVVGRGEQLPFADGSADVVMSSNVMEHVRHPGIVGREMIRAARPGGIVLISYTAWASPWGGHETSPWHLFGGEYAARRYEKRHGRPPKNRFNQSMFAATVAEGLAWGRSQADAELLLATPRYHPDWARWVLRVPGLRELTSWNLLMILRRR